MKEVLKKNFDYIIVIPARLKSSRLPNKVLKKINKKNLIEIVWDLCRRAVNKKKIFVSSSDKNIEKFCNSRRINFINSSKKCLTGTDRLVEVSRKINSQFYINVQADEILLDPNSILKVIKEIKKKKYDVVNCFKKIKNSEEYKSSSVPKVVLNKQKELIYISRAGIPATKNFKFKGANKQVCVYGFSKYALEIFGKNKKKTPLENFEDIEILRFLEQNIKVKMLEVNGSEFCIDTPEDLRKAKKMKKKTF